MLAGVWTVTGCGSGSRGVPEAKGRTWCRLMVQAQREDGKNVGQASKFS